MSGDNRFNRHYKKRKFYPSNPKILPPSTQQQFPQTKPEVATILPSLPKEPETRLVKESEYRPTKTVEPKGEVRKEDNYKPKGEEKEYLKIGKKYISKKILAYALFSTHVEIHSRKEFVTLFLSGTGKEFAPIEIWDNDEVRALKNYLERNSEEAV